MHHFVMRLHFHIVRTKVSLIMFLAYGFKKILTSLKKKVKT